ncbi:site-specific DNA-methyltransferase, partial [Hydrogenimonas sp.]
MEKTMTQKQKKLIDLLREMFQLDQSDLDFGIYRIMNAKAKEIEEFLQNDLMDSIKEAFADSSNAKLEAELEKAIEGAKAAGFDPDESPKVKELKAQLESLNPSEALENDIYSHLVTFFSRYYKDGDFISLRRYKKDTYAIPYEGEEVKLYWANFDQYYIKTSEYFKDYAFKAKAEGLIDEEKTIHFKLVEADVESNNNKATSDKERRFVLHEEKPLEVIDGEFYIYFEYRSVGKVQQKKLNEKTVEAIFAQKGFNDYLELLKTPAPTDKNKDRTLLEKHLSSYTARNTFDYFIHKDLGGFLHRELDFYIKNAMLHIDDIEKIDTAKLEEVMGKVKTFKTVAKKIIAFLTQLEEFQKKLWLKKKFVIETNYCITLDRIPEDFYEEILNNEVQLAEWKRLYRVDADSVETLKEEKYLVLDTKFFDREFKDRLLETFDDLDEAIDGVLVKSENFGALNLLQERYREQVKCVYIDPPYNSPSSEIAYKNNFKHSSWLSLMENRLSLSKITLKQDGSTIVAIDENEFHRLFKLIEDIFPDNDNTTVSIEHNKKGIQGSHFSFTNEFAIFSIRNSLKKLNRKILPENEWEYSNLRNWGGESERYTAKNCFYPIYVKNMKIIGFGDVLDDNEYPGSPNVSIGDDVIAVYPIDSDGTERKWRYSRESVERIKDLLKVEKDKSGNLQIKKAKNDSQFKTMWYSPIYNAGDYGTRLLTLMGFRKGLFDFPKSVYTVKDCIFAVSNQEDVVLDYFAGSGTTGHAVIKLNREDGGKRKYILVEMGEYFDTVTKPRIQKVIYSDNWKEGKPQDKEGNSHMFKYICLESYEDTLGNLAFDRTETQNKVLAS